MPFRIPPTDARHEPRATEAQVLALSIGDFVWHPQDREWLRIVAIDAPRPSAGHLYVIRRVLLENPAWPGINLFEHDAGVGTHRPACWFERWADCEEAA